MSAGATVEAVVTKVDGEGDKRFAVTYTTTETKTFPKDTVVTFSLIEWAGENPPMNGQLVLLEEFEKFERGWRARRARPITPVR